VAEKCRQLSNQKVLEVVADMTKDEDIKRLLNETINAFGKLDVLVNNAGVFMFTPVSDPNIMKNYETIMSTNVKGVLLLSTLAVPYLEKTKGNIINVSSTGGMRPSGPFMINCMAKSALDMMTKCLALELGPKRIRVNSINPAAIRTPIFDKLGFEEFSTSVVEKMSVESYPLGRIGEPIDCAKAVAYLASDDSSFVSGVTLPVDGGSLYANMLMPKDL
jgi:NAD(P)-dependent dehydrogenase (short-subunit alcohol dehydrogenase family)